MLVGLFAAFGTLLLWSVGTIAFLDASRRIDPGLLNRTRLLLAVAATFVLACITMQQMPWIVLTSGTAAQWLYLGLSGVIGLTVGDLLGFTSLRILGAKRQSVIGTTAPAAAACAGFFLLNETLSVLNLAGMALSIGGVMYAMSSAEEKTEVHTEGFGSFTSGVLLAVGGAACQGAGLVVAKMGLHADGGGMAPFHATFMRMSVGFLATYLLDVARRAPHRPLRQAFADKRGTRSMFVGTLFGPICGVTLSLIAADKLPTAIAQTIFSLIPFVVMAIATLVHREPLRWRSVLGAAISIVGIVLLVYGR